MTGHVGKLRAYFSQMDSRASKSPAVREVTEEIRRAAAMLSKLGAAKGGQARARLLSPEKRSRIARKAARARWSKQGSA